VVHALLDSAYVADREQPTQDRVSGVIIGFLVQRRHVVGSQDAVEPDLAVSTHAVDQIGRAGVVPRLAEVGPLAFDIAEVDEEDLVLIPELTDHGRQILRHQGEVPLA
jgi:hypothetical protein